MSAKNRLPKDLLKIEKRLQSVLQPVQPNLEFVTTLRERLDQEMTNKVKSQRVKTGLLVAGGIVGFAVMVITLIRTIMTWPSAIQSLAGKFRKREQAASV